MRAIRKWAGIAAAAVAIAAVLAAAGLYFASEAILARHFSLPPSSIHASSGAAAVARGDRMAHAYGCTDCHTRNLRGTFIPDFGISSRNLTTLATVFSDADFDRVIRHGLRPDGTSVAESMPSDAFQYMPNADLADILALIRSRPVGGASPPEPSFGLTQRIGLLLGTAKTDVMWFGSQKPALDLGPRHARGRQLAMTACGECHTTTLRGETPPQPGHPPDLSIVAAYARSDFLKFMHTGKAMGNRELGMMSAVARVRISHLTDADLNALYDYLAARGKKLTGG